MHYETKTNQNLKPNQTKPNHSHWGKQTTVSEGVLCSKVAPELSSPTVAHCYGERESHTHQPGKPRGRNTELKSMCEATMTRAAGWYTAHKGQC